MRANKTLNATARITNGTTASSSSANRASMSPPFTSSTQEGTGVPGVAASVVVTLVQLDLLRENAVVGLLEAVDLDLVVDLQDLGRRQLLVLVARNFVFRRSSPCGPR